LRYIPEPHVLRAARVLLGTSLEAAATEMDISRTNLNNIEIGRINARIDTLFKITDYLEAKGVEFAPGGWVRLTNAVTKKSHKTPGDPE